MGGGPGGGPGGSEGVSEGVSKWGKMLGSLGSSSQWPGIEMSVERVSTSGNECMHDGEYDVHPCPAAPLPRCPAVAAFPVGLAGDWFPPTPLCGARPKARLVVDLGFHGSIGLIEIAGGLPRQPTRGIDPFHLPIHFLFLQSSRLSAFQLSHLGG